MSLEKAVRNTLRIVVTQSRKLLEEAMGELLQGQFGIHASGKVEDAGAVDHLSAEDHEYREQILIHLEHIKAAGFKPSDAVAQLVREVAFTHLNRLCAYKVMETRGLIRESVSRGLKSRGFLFYLADHPADEQLWSSGKQDIAYRHFLTWLGGTLSEEIGVLFSPHDSASHLFPPQRVLEQVQASLNSDELQEVWAEDETIGWVYQYFTPKELRDQARKESLAPRNSYELAFRNQFYTPRYVVQFLTDNTLGRTWYEMRQGNTRLKDQCTYLVRRPDEVFLAEAHSREVAHAQRWLQGEDVPEPDIVMLAHTVNAYHRVGEFGEETSTWLVQQLSRLTEEGMEGLKTQELLDCLFLLCRYDRFNDGLLESKSRETAAIMNVLRERVRPPDGENPSQEELLRAPMFIPYRAKKDPREIKILDPACGSGHFLLYCFDLLETIYEEAYNDSELGPALQRDYATLADLKKAIPGLILANNLHGIDIDLRATQIAALALWLRAQRTYQEMGLKNDERPRVTRSNIVCAEPMPGEKDLLAEFTRNLRPIILGDLVRTIFEKMQLASEAGSLLRIEEEIKESIQEARQRWLLRPKGEQLALWPDQHRSTATQPALFDETKITTRDFWDGAEARVIEALHQYARDVANGKSLALQLFADDVVQGFAFIDICQKRFDVVLMNPPFGESSKRAKSYIEGVYPRTKNDIYAAFVERWIDKLVLNGMLGAITSRTGFFLTSFQRWREEILLKDTIPVLFADLGEGVLDTAMVETAAYCLSKQTNKPNRYKTIFLRVLESPPGDKPKALSEAFKGYRKGVLFIVSPDDFKIVPGSPICYWVTASVRELFLKLVPLESDGRENRVGLQTSDNFRFLRVWWEVSPLGIGYQWIPYAKGGGYNPYYRDLYLCVNWINSGAEIKDYAKSLGNSPSRSVRSEDHYFRPGLTYSDRCSGGFATSPLPKGCIFDVKGSSIFVPSDNEQVLFSTFGITLSEPFRRLLALRSGTHSLAQSFQVGQISSTPFPALDEENSNTLRILAHQAHDLKRSQANYDETTHAFCLPSLVMYRDAKQNLTDIDTIVIRHTTETKVNLTNIQSMIDDIAWKLYDLDDDDKRSLMIEVMESSKEINIAEVDTENGVGIEVVSNSIESKAEHEKSLLQWIMGIIFGRWDIRMAFDRSLIPKLHGAFDPLPVCSPGMLVDSGGFSATADNIVSEELLRARLNTTTLPPIGEVNNPTIPDSRYPLKVLWNGILVDDPDHLDDIAERIRNILIMLWKEHPEAIELEACQIIGVKGLRDYFRRPGNDGFWMDHVERYSKGRRQAPIYWLLQSSKKNYALWLYYHRLDKDILFKALTSYVEPKLRLEEGRLAQLRTQLAGAGSAGREVRQLEKQLERQESLMAELYDFRDKLRRAADLQLVPDLNDGVVLNIAPLWELVPWSEARRYWEELRAGKYEWSSISKQLRERKVI